MVAMVDAINAANCVHENDVQKCFNDIDLIKKSSLNDNNNNNNQCSDLEANQTSDDFVLPDRKGFIGFIKFLIFDVLWIKLIFELFLFSGFAFYAPLSIYEFFAYFWTQQWFILLMTWCWSK